MDLDAEFGALSYVYEGDVAGDDSADKMNESIRNLSLCLRVWRGRDGKTLEKRNEQVGEREENGRGGLWGFNFEVDKIVTRKGGV